MGLNICITNMMDMYKTCFTNFNIFKLVSTFYGYFPVPHFPLTFYLKLVQNGLTILKKGKHLGLHDLEKHQ